MNEKLQELTQKIYLEGLEKGKKEAEEIINNARREADELISVAKAQAEQIIENARKEADELRKNVHSELKLATRQAIAALKQKIAELISQKAVDDALNNVLADKEFVKQLILKLVSQWGQISQAGQDILVYLPEKDRKDFETLLLNNSAQAISKGFEITFEDGIKSGFRIGPKDGSYKISFTDKDFEHFFKQYLRPRTQQFFSES